MTNQKQQALDCLKHKHSGATKSTEQEPSAGASLLAQIVENIQLLRAQHIDSERLNGSKEAPIFINPKDPNEYFMLTADRLALWVQTMVGQIISMCFSFFRVNN